MSESIDKIKVGDITYDIEDSIARAGVMSKNDKEKFDKVQLFESITWTELKLLKDNSKLVPGTQYRITDYVTTTTQSNTRSAGNQFDIIVEALTENTLSELASACLHEGDTYFSSNGCVLESWQLWYDIENDTDKYEWADAENGKGVIYRMIDEKRNDCPYDFKNILFYTDKYTDYTTADNYYYTFSYVVNNVLYDGTVEKQVKYCYNNSIGVYRNNNKKALNLNIFRNISFGKSCYSNTFGSSCYYNTFGNDCYSNTFGDNCYSNTFGNYCNSNTFGYSCRSNTFGYSCRSNTFGYSCHSNKFGNYCHYNTFGNDCHTNTFGNYCNYNTFGNSVIGRKVDGERISITLNDEYYDDGTDALVPIKHPDLSTQPSILPYKFMGQYVYEQLISIENYSSVAIPYGLLAVDNPIILECFYVGTGYVAPCEVRTFKMYGEKYMEINVLSDNAPSSGLYYKIIYTSQPLSEDSSYYY